MNYFEKTGYKKEQNRKDLTWKEVNNLPIYVMTDTGHLWQGDQKISEKAFNRPCYIARCSYHPIVLYFFEKATLKKMKGVKLYLVQKIFDRAKKTYDLNSDRTLFKDRYVFITPDWKIYDKNGNPTKINYLKSMMLYAPSYYDFQMFKNYSHDLRMVGEFREGTCNSFSCERMLSPATVDILKEAGFDMTTSMLSTWQFKSGYRCYDIPEDSYLTEWFVENLIHPNRVARRKKENSLIKHDHKYYHDLMGNKDFLVFEEEGQAYIAQKSLSDYASQDTFHDHCGITVSYLKMLNRKAPFCVFYSEKGAKKLAANSIRAVFDYEYSYSYSNHYYYKNGERFNVVKDICENAIDQLLKERQLLEKTEVFKNLIPTLEKAKKDLNDIRLNYIKEDFATKIFTNLSYILSPVGQKDRVFEETVKQNGLDKGMSAAFFLKAIGEIDINPILKQKTPYGQVRLTKSVYYELRKMVDNGITINLLSMIKGLTTGAYSWRMTTEEYLAKRSEFCPYLTSDFLDLLKRTTSTSYGRRGISYGGPSIESWESLLRLAGKDLSSPLSEKIAAVTRLLKKFDSDVSLSKVFSENILRDYYRQTDELAPLGLDWPQRYEEFHVKNIMWFLGTIRRNSNLVNRAKCLIPYASFEQRIKILHELQNQISALNKLEIEKAALQQMDKQYAPWKGQLKKALAWKGQNFGIFIPDSLAELTMEGKTLHHCVGSYKQDVALGKEGILFLRKLSCPDTPYYTLDVVKGPNGKYQVRQCHGNCNSNPTPEIVETLKQWAADTGKVDENSISSVYKALCCL